MKTLSKLLHLSMLLLVFPARCAWGAELPPVTPARVGDLGDPAQLSIEGVQIFTQDEIRRALQSDLDYLVAAHPEATLSECLAALRSESALPTLTTGSGTWRCRRGLNCRRAGSR